MAKKKSAVRVVDPNLLELFLGALIQGKDLKDEDIIEVELRKGQIFKSSNPEITDRREILDIYKRYPNEYLIVFKYWTLAEPDEIRYGALLPHEFAQGSVEVINEDIAPINPSGR